MLSFVSFFTVILLKNTSKKGHRGKTNFINVASCYSRLRPSFDAVLAKLFINIENKICIFFIVDLFKSPYITMNVIFFSCASFIWMKN